MSPGPADWRRASTYQPAASLDIPRRPCYIYVVDTLEQPQTSALSLTQPEALQKALTTAGSNSRAAEIVAAFTTAVEQAHSDILRLVDVPDATLEEIDTADIARQAYTRAYRQVLAYLRRIPTDAAEHNAIARVALGYIAHAERNRLEVLRLGNTKNDAQLQAELARLREEATSLAAYRSQTANGHNTKAPGPPAIGPAQTS